MLLFVYSRLSLNAFAAEKITIDVTGIATGDQVSHDCQNYLVQGYDQNNHWQECQICGKKYNISQHKFTETWLNGDSCSAVNKLQHYCGCGYKYETENTRAHKDVHSTYRDREYALIPECFACSDWITDQIHYCIDQNGNRLSCTNPGTCAECGHTYESVHRAIPHLNVQIDNLQQFYAWEDTQTLANGYELNCEKCGKYLGKINSVRVTYLKNSSHDILVEYDFTLANNPRFDWYERWVAERCSQKDIQSDYDQQTGRFTGQTVVFNKWPQTETMPNSCIFHGYLADGDEVEIGAITFPIQVDTQPVILKSSLTDLNTLDGWSTGKQIDLAGTTDYLQALTVNIYDNQTKYADNVGFSSDNPQQMGEATWQHSIVPDIEADENGKDITISVKNNAGLETKKIIRVSKVDKVAPVLDGSDESTGDWATSRDYTATIYDGGIGQVETQLNSIDSWVKADSIDEQVHHDYKQQYEFTGDIYKPVTLVLNIKDGLGNQRAEKITVDKLDNTKPHVAKTVLETNNGYSIKIYGNDIKDGLGEGSHIQKYMIIKDTDTEPTNEQDSRWITWDGGYAESGTSSDTEAIMYFITDDTQINSDGQYKVYLIDNAGNISDAYETEVKSTNQSLVTIDVTGLITSSDIGHDCQKYLTDEYDQNNHWQRCTICDRKYNIQAHTMTAGYWTGGQAQNCRSDNFFVRTCTDSRCGYEQKTQTGRAAHNMSSETYYSEYQFRYKICSVCSETEVVCHCTINGKCPGCNVEGYCDKCGYYWHKMEHFLLADAVYDSEGNKVVNRTESAVAGYTTYYKCIHCGKQLMTANTQVTQVTSNRASYRVDITAENGCKITGFLGPYFQQANGQTLLMSQMSYKINSDTQATMWYTVQPQSGMYVDTNVVGYGYIQGQDQAGWPFGTGLYPFSTYGITNAVDVTAPQIDKIDYLDNGSSTWTDNENLDWQTGRTIRSRGTEQYSRTVYMDLYDLDEDKTKSIKSTNQTVNNDCSYQVQFLPDIEADENGHVYRLRVQDSLHNRTDKNIVLRRIDRVAPKIDTIDSTQTEWSKSKTVKLYGTDKGINQVSINFNDLVPLERDSQILNATTSGYEYNQEVKLIGDVYGQVAANVTYTDGLGNGTNKRLKIYNLDNTKPQVLSIDTDLTDNKTFHIFANDMHPTLGEGSHVVAYMIKQDNTEPLENASNWKAWTADVPETGSSKTNTATGYMEDSVNSYGVYYAFVKDAVGNISEPYMFEVKQRPRLYITAKPTNNVGRGYVTVDWSTYDWPNKYYKVYRQDDDGKTYQSVGVDYHLIKRVRVLQVYPDVAGQDNLHNWVVDTGYGQGIIQVDQVSQTDFNRNPTAYLNENNGSWNYDVLFFGTWDRNYHRDLSAASYTIVNKFAQSGHGIILGHDTALNNGRDDIYETNDGAVKHQQNYYDRLALDYLKIIYYDQGNEVGSTEVEIIKTGLFTTYPNYVGVKGTKLTIPACHSWGQRVYQGYENNIWLEFRDNQIWGSTAWFGHGGGNFYMITYNNIAMIQTGHSNGAATSDEQKILSNLILYMNQILFNMYYNVDYAAMDITPPTVPVIQPVNSDYIFDSEDIGNNYKYYVEAYTKDGIAPENYIETSNIADALVKTELKGYYYIIDQNNQTVVTESNGTYIDKDNNKVSPGLQNVVRYLHVAAIDNGGNLSATRTIEIPARLTISYDKNQDEATGTMTDQIINYGQTAIIKTNEFSWAKHRFTNWNVNKDNNGQVFMPGDTVSYQALAPKYGYDITMYAQWEPLYKLEINPQSGEYLGNSQKQTYWLGKDDEKIIDDATRIGYNFRGWTIDVLRE